MSNTGHCAEPIFVLNRLIGMPISYAMEGCQGDRDAALYFLDYNYIRQERTAACLADLARVGAEQHLAFSDKTLILSAKGLHPANNALLEFVRQFRSHHLFFELWNGIKEVVLLANAQLDHIYFMPVAARLDRPPAARVALRPNNRVFVSLGGDDDTDLIRLTIERCPNLQFFVPEVAWAKPGSEKNFFAVRVGADNVTPVDCAQVQRDRQPTFSPHYQSAYDACDTVLVATVADKMHQMRGGIRLADALRARKHIVTTENPLCQLVMAQHERTCLVAPHDPAALAAQLTRICDGDFQVDEATYEAVRHLTTESNQLPWMLATATQGEPAQRSVFARGRDLLGVARASLFAARPRRARARSAGSPSNCRSPAQRGRHSRRHATQRQTCWRYLAEGDSSRRRRRIRAREAAARVARNAARRRSGAA